MSANHTLVPARAGGLAWHVTDTLRIALPLAAAQLAQIGMGLTDTALLGTIGPDALAAGGLGATIEFSIFVILQGVLAAVGILVAQARGAGRTESIPVLYSTGILLALLLMVPFFFLLGSAEPLLLAAGESPRLAADTAEFLNLLRWSLPGALLGTGLQRAFLPAIDAGWIIFPVTLAGTILNGLLCYGLIHGTGPLPALGFRGPAVATSIVITLNAAALFAFAHSGARARLARLRRPRWAPLKALLRLGLPIAGTFAVETGLFLGIALLIGTFGPDALAAQQVALSVVSTAFMIPVGIAQAANVRVGVAVGAGDRLAARRAGLAAIGLGAAVEFACAAVSLLAPAPIARLFLAPDTAAFQTAIALLGVAAVFQVADGIQSVAAGSLRGLGDTRTPFVLAAIGYWAIGFPLAWLLADRAGMGPVGAWWGLAAGLIVVALLLTVRFLRRTRFARAPAHTISA